MRYCPYCMREIEGSWCPDCQKDAETASNGTNLAIGTILDTHYVIGICLGAGGFGVTYLAKELNLGRIVAIKEYFPSCWAYRRKHTQEVRAFPDQQLAYERGKQQFLTEGRLLAEVEDLPHIVDVYDSFEENGTSYLVMRYLKGKTLEELVRSSEKGRLSLDELLPLLLPLMKDIDCLHRMTPPILHRDITPGNIMFSRGKLQLIDFGSARQILGDKSMSAMISMGFAPPEQFSRKNQGPYTDVYAMAATILYCITGKKPQDATSRVFNDELFLPGELPDDTEPQLNAAQSAALRHAMALQYSQRTPTMAEFVRELTQEPKEAPVSKKPRLPQLHIREFLQKIVCRKWILPAAAAAILIVVLLARFWPTNSKTTTPDNQDTSENTTATDNQNTTGDTPTDAVPEPKKDEEPAEADTPTLDSVRIDGLSIEAGQSEQLKPVLTPEDYQSKEITWKSSNSAIAEVDDDGIVTAKSPGKARIDLTVDGVKATCIVMVSEVKMTSVTVKAGPDKTEYYASMPFDPTGITLEVTYSDKKTEEVTSGFECTGFSSSTAGVKTVTVSYEDMEAGTVYVTVKPKVLIQDTGAAGFPAYNLIQTVQYKNKIYYATNAVQAGGWVSTIYRKDTPSAEPVCVYRLDKTQIEAFFILKDRIFLSVKDGNQSYIATVELDGENFYAITAKSKNCIGCYYSSGWVYSLSGADNCVVRFRTDGSQYELVSSGEIAATQYGISEQRLLYAEKKGNETMVKCFDLEQKTTTTLAAYDTESVWLVGAYEDYLFYTVKEDGKKKLCIYKLNSGTKYTLDNGKTEAAVWNGQIVICDEDGNAELRSLSDPLTVTKEFKLPYALRSNPSGYSTRLIPVGKNLAFITEDRMVILINKDFKEVASFSVKA